MRRKKKRKVKRDGLNKLKLLKKKKNHRKLFIPLVHSNRAPPLMRVRLGFAARLRRDVFPCASLLHTDRLTD
jgi:hypothetical protein